MNHSNDPLFDSRIAAWLEEDPNNAPDQALTTILAAVPSISQRRRLPVPWRFRPMPNSMKLAAAAVIGVLAIGLLYLNLPGRGDVGGPSPTTTPSPTATPTTAPTPGLTPFVFNSNTFAIPLTLTMVDGWRLNEDQAGEIDILRGALDTSIIDTSTATVVSIDGVLHPWPADFAAWLATQSEFSVSPAQPTTIAGLSATIIDADCVRTTEPQNRPVLESGAIHWNACLDPERWRFIIATTGRGQTFAVWMAARPTDFTAATAALDNLLGTLVLR